MISLIILFSLAYYIVRNIVHSTYSMQNELRLWVNNKLLVVNLLMSQKLSTDFQLHQGLVSPTPTLFKSQLYFAASLSIYTLGKLVFPFDHFVKEGKAWFMDGTVWKAGFYICLWSLHSIFKETC